MNNLLLITATSSETKPAQQFTFTSAISDRKHTAFPFLLLTRNGYMYVEKYSSRMESGFETVN